MKSKFLAAVFITMSMFAGSTTSPSQASSTFIEGSDPAAAMFNPLAVDSVSMRISPEDFELLKTPNVDWNNEGPWLRCTLSGTIAGQKFGPMTVGMHLKGAWGSWRDVTSKAAFKIKVDEFVPKQTLYGQKLIMLNNMVQDPSYIHEALTYKLMRSLNIPAPRVGYSKVKLNGIDFGLHLNVEPVSKQMLSRWGITSKHLYKGGIPYFPDFVPGHETYFGIESGSTTDISDITELNQISNFDGDTWFDKISEVADMEQFTTVWAAELFAGHWDGYADNLNNFFINFDNSGKATLLPWGTDQTWNGALDYFSNRGILTSRCQSSPKCAELYLQALAKVASTAKRINLYYYGSSIRDAINSAAALDPWNNNIAWIRQQQDSALSFADQQQSSLANYVVPFDTTVNAIKIDAKYFDYKQVIYLAPANQTVDLKLIPTQRTATGEGFTRILTPGLNTFNMQVISADGQHSSTNSIQLYLLTQRQSKLHLKYTSNLTLDKASTAVLKALKTKLTASSNIYLTFNTSKFTPKALVNSRIAKIASELKALKIFPSKISVLVSAIENNQLQITATYQN
jgi:CotH kinase protein